MVKKRWGKMSITVFITLALIIGNVSLALAANGEGSFLYHRFGASITPTWKFMYEDGSTSDPICPETDDVPTVSRKFAASEDNTTLRHFKGTSDRWVVDAKWEWDYDIGTAFSDFETNKPISGENYYMAEAHVNRGWIWDSYYTTMPGTIETHSAGGAIYKDTHVECDIWTENPEDFEDDTEYLTQWMYIPDEGETYEELSKDFGHAHGIYIYRWWNVIHQASGHGDPMDKLSWRDDLETFGSNFTCGVSSIATINTDDQSPLLLDDEKCYKIYNNNKEIILVNNIKTREDLQDYRSKRLDVLKNLKPNDKIMATITFNGMNSRELESFIADNNVELIEFGFSTEEGSGAVINMKDKTIKDAFEIIESGFGIEMEKINYTIVRGTAKQLQGLSSENSIYLVDPAVYVSDDDQVIEIVPPKALHFDILKL